MNEYIIACKYGQFVVLREGQYDSVATTMYTDQSVDACLRWIEMDSGRAAFIPVMLEPQ